MSLDCAKSVHGFDVQTLACELKKHAVDVDFAFLIGSAQCGVVSRGSDLDVAVYISPTIVPTIEVIAKVAAITEDAAGNICESDISVLNKASPMFRFRCLCGKRLFIRDGCMDEYLEFYSLTCREYEDVMASFQRHNTFRRLIARQLGHS